MIILPVAVLQLLIMLVWVHAVLMVCARQAVLMKPCQRVQ
ncbi:hypothetical protein Q757_07320 [Oenococcus alcoholitolerans]|uniref:Uncharacterized protein n=1 Tax=Oenococcus alcoholitolerans TaxID=931074 RepID=A0ABR4XPP7_9LACO|nr:hypothetical protein Q757_07320 [Oenococcus alcoholitolerans]